MRLYDVTGCTAQIVKPGMNLTAWAAAHALSVGSADSSPEGGAKLFALCNASLYDFATRIPIGTIIEGGRIVHNDGNGYGVGVFADQTLYFGAPFEKHWKDFLTGYNSPVQNGKYIEPTFQDAYVFGCRLARIGVGYRQGKTLIVTDDGVTLREFAMNAISQGITALVNLDGGGSRHLLYNGSLIYQSPRVPYNAIAFYREMPIPQSPDGDSSLSQREPRCEYCDEEGRCTKWNDPIKA